MSISVRDVEAKDQPRWRELFEQYVRFYEARVPADVIELTWQRVLGRQDGMFGLVAEVDGGRLVGIAVCVLHRSSWSPTYYCYLEDLFVDPAVRGQGVGRALIAAVYAEADARQATRTYWATAEDNVTAQKLYDKVARKSPFIQYRR